LLGILEGDRLGLRVGYEIVKREEERRVSICVLSCLDAGILKRLIDAIQHISHTKKRASLLSLMAMYLVSLLD